MYTLFIQSNADAGLHSAGRMMVTYLRHFLAIRSRSGYERAPRFTSSRGKESYFFFEIATFLPASLYFEVGHLSSLLFHGLYLLKRMQRILFWIKYTDPEIMKCEWSAWTKPLTGGRLSVAGQQY